MKFPADINVFMSAVLRLRSEGHDVVHVREVGYRIFPIP